MDVRQVDVYKVTEWKAGQVYKTKKVCMVWIPSDANEAEVAKKWGGDIIAATVNWLFGVKVCEPLGQSAKPQ